MQRQPRPPRSAWSPGAFRLLYKARQGGKNDSWNTKNSLRRIDAPYNLVDWDSMAKRITRTSESGRDVQVPIRLLVTVSVEPVRPKKLGGPRAKRPDMCPISNEGPAEGAANVVDLLDAARRSRSRDE